VDLDPVADTLVSDEGFPVWPVRSRGDLAALKRVAATFGAVVSPTRGRAAEDGMRSDGVEEVASLGNGTQAPARLYAHLTGRSHRATTPEGVLRGHPPAVVVTPLQLLTDAFLEGASGGAADARVIGIVSLPKAAARARRQVLVRSAAAALRGPLERREVLFFPRVEIQELVDDERWILGAKTPRDRILDTFRGGAGVLAVSAHSDGIDVDLGSELMLCPFGGRDDFSVEADRAPRCRIEGHCHRLDQPVSAAWDTGRLATTDCIAARVLVLYTCQGLLHRDGVVHPDWGIVPRLLENAAIGAVVTSWSFIFATPPAVASLSGLVSSGLPLGEALSEYNRSSAAFDLGHSLCLFGDPGLRLPPKEATASRSAGPVREAVRVPPTTARSASTGEYTLLRACFPPRLDDLPAPDAALASRALETIRLYEDACWRDAPTNEEEMGWAFVDYAVGGGAQTLGIAESVRFARSLRGYKRPGTCFACGRRRRSVLVTLRLPGTKPRRMDTCPRCGITSDAPTHLRIELKVERRLVQLTGPRPQKPWAAGLYVKSWHKAESFGLRWPADEDGRPVDELALRRSLPSGQLRLYFYLVARDSLAIASCPTRGDLGGPRA